jgi:RecG-like helicase
MRQHGDVGYRVAQLPEDEELLVRAHAHAERLLRTDPELVAPEHVLLADALATRHGDEALAPLSA